MRAEDAAASGLPTTPKLGEEDSVPANGASPSAPIAGKEGE
jgi:hypothetical protein